MSNISSLAKSQENKSRADLGLNQSVDWCAEFVSWVIDNSDIPDGAKTVTSISCNYMINAMRNNPYWYEPDDAPQVGDIVFFDWNGADDDLASTKPLDHVGVIIGVDANNPNRVITIEGNTEGTQSTSRILKKERLCTWNAEYPDYYMRYREVNPTPETKTPPRLTDTELESLINEMRATIQKWSEMLK